MLAFWVIGAILIVLGVIGLAGALVIRPVKVSKISENILGRDSGGHDSQVMGPDYYPASFHGGVLGMLRTARTGSGHTGRDSGQGIEYLDRIQPLTTDCQ